MRPRSSLTAMAALGVAIISLAPAPAAAQAVATGLLTVTATVLKFCTVGSSALAFGNYTPAAESVADTTVQVTCTAGTPYVLAMTLPTGDTPAARQMTGPTVGGTATPLLYALYRDAARSQLWGQTAGNDTLAGSGTGLPASIPIYGRIPANQSPGPGAYTQIVTMTLTY